MAAPAAVRGGYRRHSLSDDQRCDRDIGGIGYVGHHRHRRPYAGQRGARHADLHRACDGRVRDPDRAAQRWHRGRQSAHDGDRAHPAVAHDHPLGGRHHRHTGQFRDDHIRASGDRIQPRRPVADPGRARCLAGGGHTRHHRLADLHAGQPRSCNHGRRRLPADACRRVGWDRRWGWKPTQPGDDFDLDPRHGDRRARRPDGDRLDGPQRHDGHHEAGGRHARAHRSRDVHRQRDRRGGRTGCPRRRGARKRAGGRPRRGPSVARCARRRLARVAGARRPRAARSWKRLDHGGGRGLRRRNAPAAADRRSQRRNLGRCHRDRIADGSGIGEPQVGRLDHPRRRIGQDRVCGRRRRRPRQLS